LKRINEASIKVLHNGSIYGHPSADAIVLERDRIRMIGQVDEIPSSLHESDQAVHIDLEGQIVLPGFIDAHIHMIHTGLVECGWRVGLMNLSRDDALETLAQAVADRDGEWVLGTGWDESHWQDRSYLTRAELDRIAPHSPLLAIRMDGHLLTANSVALKQIPAGAPEHLIERETGILREQAVAEMAGSIQPDFTASVEAIDAGARLCHRLGITTVHTMSRLDFFEAFMIGRDRRKLRVTICPDITSFDKLLAVGLKTGYGDAWLRFGGMKMFADGSIGARNAAISEPYIGGGLGELNHEDDVLHGWVKKADRSGWQTIIHAIGDRAIEQTLRIHETLQTNVALQHRIEHFELPQASQLARVKAAGLHLCMQPNFTANWSGPDSMYVDRLGIERDQWSNPLRAIHDAGIPVAFGSDGMPPSPLYGLDGAIHGAYPAQRIAIEEAISCYTEAGAQFGFEGDEKGCLQPGSLADLVVLDEDPRTCPDQVGERSIRMTWVGGDLVYSAEAMS
jgi:predicted amidohydrolase YtcJ